MSKAAPCTAPRPHAHLALLSAGDVVVHVMTAEQREYYDLETLYSLAEEVPLELAGPGGGDAWSTSL